jgi:lactate dehydrogenase-like 2-hydroxyacid dehydrogenase
MTLGNDPEGKTLGILGMGGIGNALAQRAKGFDMEVIYHNRKEVAPEDNRAGAEYIKDVDEFWGRCDIVSFILLYLPQAPC